MATITLADAQEQLATWMAANLAVAKGQAYTIGDRTLTRVHSSEILKQINYWSAMEAQLSRQGNSEPSVSISHANLSGK